MQPFESKLIESYKNIFIHDYTKLRDIGEYELSDRIQSELDNIESEFLLLKKP